MSTVSNTVRATHLECVDSDHNKYYRTFLVTPTNGRHGGGFLVRNWGRRGAPKGQWLRSNTIGVVGARSASFDLRYEKECKGYFEIHDTHVSIDDSLVDALFHAPGRGMAEEPCGALSELFEAQWCEDIEDVQVPDGTHNDVLAWVSPWKATRIARAPARMLAERHAGDVLHVDSNSDLAVLRVGYAEALALQAAYDYDAVSIVDAHDDDNADTVIVAQRLWSPSSNGPYRQLGNAVRDARRIFRRTPTNTAAS